MRSAAPSDQLAVLLRDLETARQTQARLRAMIDALVGAARLVREGDYWTLAHGGADFRLRDSKGLRHLALLVARPHVEIHAVDLVGVVVEDRGEPPAYLDRQAKAAYRQRLAELRDQLVQAQGFADAPRRAHIEAEIAAITAELARAVGLGGRDRRASPASERARINATRTLKEALARIASCDRELGRHLAVSIRTGTYCCYAPHRELAWELS